MAGADMPASTTWSATSESRLLRITPVSQEIILNYVNDHVPKLPKS
jgi:hypothetical protein